MSPAAIDRGLFNNCSIGRLHSTMSCRIQSASVGWAGQRRIRAVMLQPCFSLVEAAKRSLRRKPQEFGVHVWFFARFQASKRRQNVAPCGVNRRNLPTPIRETIIRRLRRRTQREDLFHDGLEPLVERVGFEVVPTIFAAWACHAIQPRVGAISLFAWLSARTWPPSQPPTF
jgi:hypothetical protein